MRKKDGEVRKKDGEIRKKDGEVRKKDGEVRKKDGEVRKKDGELRHTADYQQLNVKTIADVFPLPLIKECIDHLADNLWFHFHTLHLVSGYWEIMVDEHDSHKMAFLTKYGLSEHIRMAQGLCSAHLQRVMKYKLCNGI